MDNSGVNISNFVVPPVEGVAGGGTGYGWTEGCNQRSNFGRGIIDPTQIPSADLLHVWCMPSTTNVGDQEMPRPFNHVSLLAARNERESVQIALRPKFSWVSSGIAGTVQIQCTDLFSASGDSLVVGKSLTMRRVVPILGVPDALVPLSLPITQINLLPGETTSIWVSVDVPVGQPPGQYEGHMLITALKADAESAQVLAKANKYNVYREVNNCLEIVESIDGKPPEEVAARMKSTASSLKRLLLLPVFQELSEENGSCDMMDEDAFSNISINLKISVTVWEFTLPLTPSLPAVFGISETVIEDRFGLEHGSEGWYDSLDRHFKWLLQYRISPYFCRWGDSMRILAYTCPWPADHPRSEEYYSDPRLAAYAVPYTPIFACNSNDARESLHKDVEVLKSKHHWRKAYFYLWDEPQNSEQYELIRSMSADIRSYAPDARVLTTYYCGPNDAHYGPNSFESFVKVPNYLRPHTQIFCTSEWVFGNREDLVSDVIAELQPENGEEWWTYVCMGPTDPQPNWHLGMRGTQHRAVMWRVWKEGGTGFLYWGANCYDKSLAACAEIKFRHGLPPGDGVLFYPGEVFSSSHEPVASIRLERILSGMQDFEYLKLYSSRYGREEGLALLERTGVYHSPERYTLEHSPVDLMRAEIYRTCRS